MIVLSESDQEALCESLETSVFLLVAKKEEGWWEREHARQLSNEIRLVLSRVKLDISYCYRLVSLYFGLVGEYLQQEKAVVSSNNKLEYQILSRLLRLVDITCVNGAIGWK